MKERANARARGYTRRWEKARITYLRSHPLCVYCEQQGKVASATVVDHIQPHKGDQALFWNQDNWQALCKPCHDRHKQAEEHRGMTLGAGADGIPLDARHHWRV